MSAPVTAAAFATAQRGGVYGDSRRRSLGPSLADEARAGTDEADRAPQRAAGAGDGVADAFLALASWIWGIRMSRA